jgi:hypothetical protein
MLGWTTNLLLGLGTKLSATAAYLNPTTNLYSLGGLAAAGEALMIKYFNTNHPDEAIEPLDTTLRDLSSSTVVEHFWLPQIAGLAAGGVTAGAMNRYNINPNVKMSIATSIALVTGYAVDVTASTLKEVVYYSAEKISAAEAYGIEKVKEAGAYLSESTLEFAINHPVIASGIAGTITAVATDALVTKPHGYSPTISKVVNMGAGSIAAVGTYFSSTYFTEQDAASKQVAIAEPTPEAPQTTGESAFFVPADQQ